MRIEQHYNLFGYRFTFRTNYARAAELIANLYAGRTESRDTPNEKVYALMREVGERGEEQWILDLPGPPPHTKPSLGDCLAGLEASISINFSRQNQALHVVHGGVVYGPEGGILISGHSGAGKTTLSLALATRGLLVGGDDLAVLDSSSNLIEPIPRCFHIDEKSASLLAAIGLPLPADALRDQFVTPGHLGVAELPPAHIRFAFMLEPERRSVPELVPQTQAQMASALLKQTGRGFFSNIEGVHAMARLVGDCRCYRLWSGELEATVEAVMRVVSGQAV
jgi:hypothetical protein